MLKRSSQQSLAPLFNVGETRIVLDQLTVRNRMRERQLLFHPLHNKLAKQYMLANIEGAKRSFTSANDSAGEMKLQCINCLVNLPARYERLFSLLFLSNRTTALIRFEKVISSFRNRAWRQKFSSSRRGLEKRTLCFSLIKIWKPWTRL